MKAGNKVRSLIRGLEVLEAINRANGANVREVAKVTGLNRGTVYRLLESLCDEGFLDRRANSNGYWLSKRVPGLSVGYRSDAWVSQIAEPALQKLTQTFDWPVSLLIPMDTRMIVLAHTEHLSPVTFRIRDLGLSMSMFNTSSGLTYLAFASTRSKTTLLESGAQDAERKGVSATVLRRSLGEIAKRGYHIVDSPDRGTALSVPVMVGEASFGVISLRYFTTAMTHGAAVRKYLGALKHAAAELGQALERRDA